MNRTITVAVALSGLVLAACKQGDPGPANTNPYYADCDDVRRAGKAPIETGDPGYRLELDRDHNGVACG